MESKKRIKLENELFDETNKNDNWETLIEMLSDKELERLLEEMKEYNDL